VQQVVTETQAEQVETLQITETGQPAVAAVPDLPEVRPLITLMVVQAEAVKRARLQVRVFVTRLVVAVELTLETLAESQVHVLALAHQLMVEMELLV